MHATPKDVTTHEVGHTLGFRHNFRASTIYTQAQINDPAFTRANGIGGSVMDYNAFNVALDKEPLGQIRDEHAGANMTTGRWNTPIRSCRPPPRVPSCRRLPPATVSAAARLRH